MRIGQDQSLQHIDRCLPDLISSGLLAEYALALLSIWMISGKKERSSCLHPSLDAKISTQQLLECNSHCKAISQDGSLHHLYIGRQNIHTATFRMQWPLQGITTRRISSSSLPAIISGQKIHTLFYPTNSHKTA